MVPRLALIVGALLFCAPVLTVAHSAERRWAKSSSDGQGAAERRSRAPTTIICVGCESSSAARVRERPIPKNRAKRQRVKRPSTWIVPLQSVSTPETRSQELNRSVILQQQILRLEQQNQFEMNQLRNSLQQNQIGIDPLRTPIR